MSSRFLDAFKIALSISIVYGISLSMAWDNPHWAAFSVAFCSLATVGESLLKGLLRTFGTFAAVFVAIALLALFPQDRWIFTTCVSLWVAFCTWKMYANPNWYFWFCAGLGVPLLSMLSGGESLTAFQTVVLRAQQTILGTLVFSVVSSLLFPSNTRGAFENDVKHQLADVHAALTDTNKALLASGLTGEQLAASVAPLKQSILRQTGLAAKLQAAALDSFDIAETKHSWRKAVAAVASVIETLERLRLGLPDLEGTKPIDNLANLEVTLEELLRRLRVASELAEGKEADSVPHPISSGFVATGVDQMPAFQRAALSQLLRKIDELDRYSERLLIAIADVRGFAKDAQKKEKRFETKVLIPDPERVYGTLRVFTAFWMTFLAYIYVPDLPSWVVLIAMTTAISMLMMMAPALPLWGLTRPVILSIFFAGSIHIFLMPHFGGFLALGLTVFVATFLICWLCHTPQQAMGRALGLAFFAVLTQIENSQTYSFTFVANLTVAFGLVVCILAFVSHFPITFKPERVFLRMIHRYFSSIVALLETMHLDERSKNSWFERQRRAYHARQIKIIPDRLGVWIKALPKSVVTVEERDDLAGLAAGLAMLSERTSDLLETRSKEYSEEWILELVGEARAWRHAIQNVCSKLGDAAPEEISVGYLQERLSKRMGTLEDLVAKAISEGRTEGVDEPKNDVLFRELGGFRGVSLSLISLVEQAKRIDWNRLREARL